MLANSRDKLLPKTSKNQNEKTIMVPIWHPALKNLSQILREKDQQHIENKIYLKKVF